MNTRIITIIATLLLTHNTYAITDDDKTLFFDTNPNLFYKIGGANRINPPLTPDTNVTIGLNGSANIGYSCGEFDISAAFSNLMNNFKNGVDDAVNAVTNTANAAISSLPSLTLQRAMPGLYDMFQEYKIDAETDINIANKSCQEMEAQIARGENPYDLSSFFQKSKAETWKEEAAKGTLITDAQEKAEKEAGDNGVTEFGRKAGGVNQPSMRVVEDAVIAGYNYALGNTNNPMQASSAPESTVLGQTFASSSEAAIWATDVLGEFEINNKSPITKIGSGLHPKVKIEKARAMEQFQQTKYNELGIGPEVIRKVQYFSIKDQGSIYSNIIDDIAIQRTIKKGLVTRRLLLSGNQAESSDERDKKIAVLERDIQSLMFERKIRQNLANNTILEILKVKDPKINRNDPNFKTPDSNPFLKMF